MSEASFSLFQLLFSGAAQLLYAACLALFLRPFLPQARRGQRLALAVAGYLALGLFCDILPAPPGAFALLLAALLAAGAGPLGLGRAMALLLALLYCSARVSAGLVAESLYFLLDRALPLVIEPPERMFLRAVLLVILFLLLHLALLAAMLRGFSRQLRRQALPPARQELCLLCLLPAAGVLFGQMISGLLFEVENGVLLQLYERHPAFLAAVPLLALLLFAGTLLAIALTQRLAALRQEQAALLAQREALRARLEEAGQADVRVRALRHELRGHLTNLRGLAESGETAALAAYLARLGGEAEALMIAPETGDPVTDVILSDARHKCRQAGIRLDADFAYPQAAGYDPFSVGVILQNLLQNAIEACGRLPEGERFVALSGMRRGRFFLIEVKNPFAGQLALGPDGLPVTSKPAGPAPHGLGLANLRREAERYQGTLELAAEGGVFSAAVLLQQPDGPQKV